MHLLTGMLLASLFRKGVKASPGTAVTGPSPILRAPSLLSVTHALPGRTRFRVPSLVGCPDAADMLEKTLREIEPVQSVTVSSRTGSVLIAHDPEQVAPEVLAAALVRLLGLEQALVRSVEGRLSRELRAAGRAANRAVYESSAGWLDLRTVVLLTVGIVGLRKVAQQRALALPAGFTLLWWAGNGLLGGARAPA